MTQSDQRGSLRQRGRAMSAIEVTNILVLMAVAFHAAGYLVRDELWLRALILTGTGIYLVDYFLVPNGRLWDVIAAACLISTINIGMIVVLILERTTFAMSAEQQTAFRSFDTLTPGQFRKLYRRAVKNTADGPRQIVKGGEVQNRLFLVETGQVEIGHGANRTALSAPFFAGEVGFILDGPATADVYIKDGSEYLSWDYTDVRRLMDRSQSFEHALIALFSKDLARKLGRSEPKKA